MPYYPHLGAFESTKIFGTSHDILSTTKHLERWQDDLEMLRDAGIRELRYPAPWHRIERQFGEWDWDWIDGPLNLMRRLGMRPILDPLHHVSFPDWLQNGFANPEFPKFYTRFVRKVAERYPWVDRYTVVNEPLPTTILCAQMGAWYPHQRSDADFVSMAVNVARAICLASAQLRELNRGIELVHIDACEHHQALDSESEPWVEHANHRRFLYHDLILGKIDGSHPLLPYLRKYGFDTDQQHWLRDHQAEFDVLGLDYYAHSEIDWRWNALEKRAVINFPCERPRGFAEVAGDFVRRFRVPILLSETNVGGTPTDRLTWLKFMEQQAEELSRVSDFRGFCWFPSIDATDWSSLCTEARLELSPMGIWSLEGDNRERHGSLLSEWYVRLAQGRASWKDLPAYEFIAPLDRDLHGYRRLMQAWTQSSVPSLTPPLFEPLELRR